MTDQEIRREFFRRYGIMVCASIVLEWLVAYPYFSLFDGRLLTIARWLGISSIFALIYGACAAIQYWRYSTGPLFSRNARENLTAYSYLVGFALAITALDILSAAAETRLAECMSRLRFDLFLLLSLGPPWIWFLSWHRRTLSSLPSDSTLIERPKSLKKLQE